VSLLGSAAFGLSALRPDFVAAPLAGHLLFVVQGTWLLFIAFALFTAEKQACKWDAHSVR